MLVGLIASLAIIANFSSDFFVGSNPDVALKLNPLKPNARLIIAQNLVAKNLNSNEKTRSLDEAQRHLKVAMSLSPSDARSFGFMGVVQAQQGNADEALAHFHHAQNLSPAEFHSLLHMFLHNLQNNQFSEATERLSLIFKRWPSQIERIEPLLPLILTRPEGVQKLIEILPENPKGLMTLLDLTTKDPANIRLTVPLVQAWVKNDVEGSVGASNFVLSRMITARQYNLAYFFYRSILPYRDQSDSAYVINGNFERSPSSSPFDWRIRDQAGVVTTINTASGTENGYLEIRFLDSPVRYQGISQVVRLPPGRYTLSIDYETLGLKGPKPLEVYIRCLENSSLVEKMAFLDGTNVDARLELNVEIPTERCKLQKLSISSAPFAQSWQNRFDGLIRIKNVAARRESNV